MSTQMINVFLSYASPICGFVGAMLIFFYALPNKDIPADGKVWQFFASPKEIPGLKKKYKKHQYLSQSGIALIAFSFFAELVLLFFKTNQ